MERTGPDGGPPGVVLGGTASGVGKTVATLATVRALEDAGRTVATGKAGPDFIDPSHHEVVAGRPSRTLDTWLQGVDGVRRNYARSGGDVGVVEGMMGLYDGTAASTASTAAALGLPVVLVVDASAGMESVAATALGFREYARHAELPGVPDGATVEVAGVLASRARGGRHEDGIRAALPDGLAYLGRVPPDDRLGIADRHLGLEMGDEAPIDGDALDDAADGIDVGAVLDLASDPDPPSDPDGATDRRTGCTGADRPRVAIAADAAFRFVYPAVRERLAALAAVVPFAPVAGDDLPACEAVYLPGGYPELHAGALADSPALGTLAREAADGLPVLGECGGMMALVESLTTADGETREMAGVLPGEVRMHDRYRALDHVELESTGAGHAPAGETHRAHEFHYSSHSGAPDARYAYEVVRGAGIDGDRDGLVAYATVGTYAHRHAASGAFDRLVEAAVER